MNKKVTKKEILEIWRNLSHKEVLIIECTEYDLDYTIVCSKERADITFEHEVLMHHFHSSVPEHEYTDLIVYEDDDHVRIPLDNITKVFKYDKEKAFQKMKEIQK